MTNEEPLTHVELHLLDNILIDAYSKYRNYGNEVMCEWITDMRHKLTFMINWKSQSQGEIYPPQLIEDSKKR